MSYEVIPSYRKEIESAYRFQEEARIKSLVLPRRKLCGVSIKPLSVRHLVILTGMESGFVTGDLKASDIYEFVWLLSGKRGPLAWFVHKWKMNRWAKGHTVLDPLLRLADEISEYIDAQTMDMPGKYMESDGEKPFNVSSLPRLNLYLDLVLEVMGAYSAFSYSELMDMDVSLFFQILKAARRKVDPEYPDAQPTDRVQAWALKEFKKLKGEKLDGRD